MNELEAIRRLERARGDLRRVREEPAYAWAHAWGCNGGRAHPACVDALKRERALEDEIARCQEFLPAP